MRIAVIGAGSAGLTAAYLLGDSTCEVDLYEAGDCVGGLARSFQFRGQTVDLGPHRFFSQDRRVNELWLKVVGRDYAMVRRLTRILYQGKFFQYPLRPLDVLSKLGPLEAATCIASYARQRLCSVYDDSSFEGWVCKRFGKRLFDMFFKAYSEKLWGIPSDQLDADFAAQRIRKFSLSAAIRNAFSRNDPRHRTLVDEFAYPTGGTGMVYQRMADVFRSMGGNIFLRTPVRRVVARAGELEGLVLEDGCLREYDRIISTMPLTLLVQSLPDPPRDVLAAARRLTFRNTIIVYLEIGSLDICEDQWIYVHSPELRTGRITNFRNWVPQLCGGASSTILALEFWCNMNEEMWQAPDADLVELARKEILASGLVADPALVFGGKVCRLPRCYPVYRRGYREDLRPIEEYLKEIEGLQVIGRYGAFKYNNQDHSILMGILAAENVLEEAANDLWTVNSDYETYQEACTICESGLVLAGDHGNNS